MDNGRFSWIDFYVKLADKLVAFKEDRSALIEEICRAYGLAGIKLPRLDSTEVPVDIDPFTVYGLFNKGLTDVNRKKTGYVSKSVYGLIIHCL